MNKLTFFIFCSFTLLLTSCRPDKSQIIDFTNNLGQIKVIKLKANCHFLYADDLSQLTMDYDAYDSVTNTRRYKVTLPDGTFSYRDSVYIDKILLQKSRVSSLIKFYKEDGTPIPAKGFKTSDVTGFKVYAKAGNIYSDTLAIDVRTPIAVRPKIVVPVIFHILTSPGEITPVISSDYLESKLNELNDLFGRKKYFSSNGGNANIEFKLAIYHPNRTLLLEKGIDRKDVLRKGEAMKPDVVANTWNPKRYLNVWVCTYPPYSFFPAGDPYYYLTSLPVTKLASANGLSGLNFLHNITESDPVNISSPEFTGIMMGADYVTFKKQYVWRFYTFDWVTNFAEYYGVLSTIFTRRDYCSDTYKYNNSNYSFSSFEKTSLTGYKYTSENVMDEYSPKVTISAEQAERMRWVLDNCPSRWAWKSNFALTGID